MGVRRHPLDVVEPEEVPAAYGWHVPGEMVMRKKAPRFTPESQDLVKFMLVLLRRAALEWEKYDVIRQVVESQGYDTRQFDSVKNSTSNV